MVGSFISELKRRNVFKVGVAYLVLAWVVVQISDTAVPALHLPEWIITAVFFFGAIGFPFAIFFAWAFEITPEGIKKESEITPEESIAAHTGRKIDFIIIGLMAIALSYFIYESRFPTKTEQAVVTDTSSELKTESAEPIKISIAVLPFADMSPNNDHEYFSDGISEELLNLLAKIPNIQVVARTSSFQFKGKNLDIQSIAKKLGVKTILEGSVRKSGTKVRITAQLIKADDGFHIWSETYDRELDDIFKVQDEISAAIVESLKEVLGIKLEKATSTGKIINPIAYDLYLQGLKGLYSRNFKSLERAVSKFESAIKIEPNFNIAKVKLAETFINQIGTGSRFDNDILVTAESMLKAVLEKEPDSADTYYVLSLLPADVELSQKFIKNAYRLNANNTYIIMDYIMAFGHELGEHETRKLYNKAQRIDPLNANIPYQYSMYLAYIVQKYTAAVLAVKQAIKMTPQFLDYPFVLSMYYSYFKGNIADAIFQMEIPYKSDLLDPDSARFLSGHYLSLADGESAIKLAEEAVKINPDNADAIDAKVNALIFLKDNVKALKLINDTLDNPDTVYRRVTKGILVSKAIYLLLKRNDLDAAETLLDKHFSKVINLSSIPSTRNRYVDTDIHALALQIIVSKALEKAAKAEKMLDELNSLDETFFTKGQINLMGNEQWVLAILNAIKNNDNKALDYLEASIDNGFIHDWRSNILQSPYFLFLHQHPRFITLIKRLETEMVKQRALVEEYSTSG
ncbi:hypothetical protein [Colwellia piezophila]|uniref:hypothetical protein n=1 Tax=Colwellia piezophila TaxID=211668 RepID=UPI0003741668|nr:hypothetical protein [Colwellia piezophila]